jgi:hypothetical protein
MLLSNTNSNSTAWATYAHYIFDRLRGDSVSLATTNTAAEVGGWSTYLDFDKNVGWDTGSTTDYQYFNRSGSTYVSNNFRRAPGFFDVVCYTGTGADMTLAHNLAAKPELIIIKKRSAAGDNWPAYICGTSTFTSMYLNSTQVTGGNAGVNLSYGGGNALSAAPTSTNFYLTNDAAQTTNAATFVSYLFASLPGISKVGSYTGNGSSQTIACGFTAGARFVMIKRTDSTGDWYVWDTARGIVSGNDPHLSLNTSVAEVTTDDTIDPDNSGFIVNQVAATNVNVNAATYIFLSIA